MIIGDHLIVGEIQRAQHEGQDERWIWRGQIRNPQKSFVGKLLESHLGRNQSIALCVQIVTGSPTCVSESWAASIIVDIRLSAIDMRSQIGICRYIGMKTLDMAQLYSTILSLSKRVCNLRIKKWREPPPQ